MFYRNNLFILCGFLLGVVNGQLPCDSQVSDCNPITTTNFANLNSVALTYPSPTSTILGGVVYDAVYHWVPETGHDLLHSFAVYTASGTLGTCADSVIWNNGVSVPFVEETRDGLVMCYAPITEQFERDDLSNPASVYLMFKNVVSVGDTLFIDRDYSAPIVPAEDAVFYLYELFQTSLSTDATGTIITIDVNNITYTSQDFDGIGACNDIPTTMATIDVSGCSLSIATSDDINGIYTYSLPKTQYESCADTVNGIGNLITYSSTITLPTDVLTCSYFRPGDHQQVINIEFDTSNIGGTVSLNATDLSVQLIDYDLERCEPVSSYVLPNHRAIFTLNVTTGGDVNPSISSVPYLDTLGNNLQLVSTVCDVHSSGTGVECVFVLKSTDCRPSFMNDDDNCIVERFSENSIFDLDFTVGSATITVAGTDPGTEYETGLENARFPGVDCLAPANVNQVNVTDSYVGTVLVRNLPNPDWVTPTAVTMYDEIILEMTIDASDLTFAELQIQSVTVTVEDPNAQGVAIAQRVFHKADKVALEEFTWNGYHYDAHFCTWHNVDNTCPVFYEVGSDRVNAFFTSDIQSRLGDICQTSGDTSIKDYFSFDPSNWFVSFQLPEVHVKFDILSTVEFCDGRTNRRMLQGDVVNIQYVQYNTDRNIRTILYTGTNSTGAPTAAPTVTTSVSLDDDDTGVNVYLIVGLSVAAACSCAFFILIAKKKRKRNGKVDASYNSI